MTTKFLSFLLSIFLISVSIPNYTNATSSSPFTSIKHLHGGQKGEPVKGLHTVKTYLQRLGYLQTSPNQSARANDDNFDNELEAALKTYQLNYGLKPTGVLDPDTAFKMAMPRCGVPDISNGINHMRQGHDHHGNRTSLHTVSHFSFFGNQYKWPPGKKQLTYGFYQNVSPHVVTSVAGAFNKWSSASGYFTFIKVVNAKTADLKIGFERGNHGDGDPFDGPNGLIAHAFAPTDGKFHYDLDEKWSAGVAPGCYDLETLAVHEIGHLLGLYHSKLEAAIMYPILPIAAIKGLHADDIKGIKTLYNVK